MIEGIIFDADGVLFNSLPIHYEAYRITFEKYNMMLTKHEYYSNIGGTAKECLPKFVMGKKSDVSLDVLHNEKKRIFLELIDKNKVELLETAKLIHVFYGKYKLAIGSAGSKVQVFKMLESHDLLQYFNAIITGDDVSNGKPDPEVFLLAAKKMKIKPDNCMVFEDSRDGIFAAVAAGMDFFNVKNTYAT